MSIRRASLIFLALLIILIAPRPAFAQTNVSGTVTANPSVSLGGNGRLLFYVVDTATRIPVQVASFPYDGSQPTVSYSFQIPANRIQSGRTYQLLAIMAQGDQKRREGSRQLPAGGGTGLNIIATETSGRVPEGSSGAPLLLSGLLLAVLSAGLLLWRQRRQARRS